MTLYTNCFLYGYSRNKCWVQPFRGNEGGEKKRCQYLGNQATGYPPAIFKTRTAVEHTQVVEHVNYLIFPVRVEYAPSSISRVKFSLYTTIRYIRQLACDALLLQRNPYVIISHLHLLQPWLPGLDLLRSCDQVLLLPVAYRTATVFSLSGIPQSTV